MKIIVIGGGAAGFFAAINAKQAAPHAEVQLIDKNKTLLAKVRVSGGGRCNVTHSCFEPALLVKNYPRGHRELLGPFQHFQPKDTIEWFEKRGVALKTESDGRIFPVSNSSSTIIDCLLTQAASLGIQITPNFKIARIGKTEQGFKLHMEDNTTIEAQKLVLATGSSKEGYRWAEELGHTIQAPVPSLFAFNIPNFPLQHLSGIALPVAARLLDTKLSIQGPLLITHAGFSGPAILKLSSEAARILHERNYLNEVAIDWLSEQTEQETFQKLLALKSTSPQKTLNGAYFTGLPKNLWKSLVGEIAEHKLQTISDKKLRALSQKLHRDVYQVSGKTTNKEEFVTCGGVALSEVNFKTMQSKKCPGLYFAGEILDIDGVTGGFNFQNAWTTGYIAAQSLAQNVSNQHP